MTKKHFLAIAQLLKNQRLAIQQFSDDDEFGTQHLFENIIMNIETGLINIFIKENPRFDIDKFKQATEPTEEEKRIAI